MTPCLPCEIESRTVLPGVIWPIASDSDSSRSWVERCDECERFVDDYAAAEALAEHLGRQEFGVARLHTGRGKFQPYVES